jgi:hypothetical protein
MTQEWSDGPPKGLPCQGHAEEFDGFSLDPRTRRVREGTVLARSLCKRCGHTPACLEWLLRWPQQYAYGAGKTSKERVTIRRRRMQRSSE